MTKIISKEKAIQYIHENDSIMISGFMANGSPLALIEELLKVGTKNLHLIANDTSFVDLGIGRLVVNKQFKEITATHIGLNKETGRQMNEGETKVNLVPQGTLAERIRSGGFGLGGVLTPTGLGTPVEEGKEKVIVNGKEFLIEEALRANVALVFADTVDEFGNMVYKGSENNFNNVMASAADIVIVEARNIIKAGELKPEQIHTPGIFIDYIVQGE